MTLRWLIVFSVLIGLFSGPAAAQPTPWPTLHKDSSRTGRAPGVGEIVEPSVSWEVNTGGQVSDRAVLIEDVNDDGVEDYLVVVGGSVVARRLDQTLLWDTPSLGVSELIRVDDFNGDGRSEVLALGVIAVLLDGPTGRELWRFENPEGVALRNVSALALNLDADDENELVLAVARPASLSMHDFSEGFGEARRWHTTHEALPTNVSRPVIGDFEGNGRPSLAVVNQSHCQIVFADLVSGLISRVTTPLTVGSFCYGLTQAVDVDGDGRQELLFTGAVGQSNGSVGVTAYDYVEDGVQWHHEYATNTALSASLAPAGAVADLDGDGRLEFVISVFNNGEELLGDDGVSTPGAWATVVYDADTGETLGFVRDRVVVGFGDVVPGGGVELIAQASIENSVRIPSFGAVEVIGLDTNRRPVVLRQIEGALAMVQAARDNAASSRDKGSIPAVFEVDGQRLLMVIRRSAEAQNRLQALDLSASEPRAVSDQGVPEGVGYTMLRALGDVAGGAGPHVVLKTNIGLIEARDADLETRASLTFTGHVALGLLAPTGAGGLTLLFRDSARNLVAVDPATATRTEAPEELWRRPVTRRSGESVAFDQDGDGRFEVVYSGERDDGTPFIELLGPAGNRIWRRVFLEAASLPFSLVTAQFNGEGVVDVGALMFTLDGTALTVTLDGATGSTLAQHIADQGEVQRNPNRELFPLGDQDGDGASELLLLHYTTMERLSGIDLSRQGPVVSYPSQTARPANSALLESDEGGHSVFLNLFTTRKAVLDVDEGNAAWSIASEPSHNAVQANHAGLSDADGDGVWDIAIPGHLGDLTILGGLDGLVLRRLCLSDGRVSPLGAPASAETCAATTTLSSVAVSDIDGDGDEDYVVGTSEGWLYALDVGTGQSLWSVFLQAAVRLPMIADIDGDGLVEVVVSTADSRLVAVDNAVISAVEEVREVLIDTRDQIVAADNDIDFSSRLDALGVAWDPVEGAEGYLVTILSENLNEVTPPIEVTEVTGVVVTGLSLIPGARYVTRVVPFSAQAGSAAPTVSDGVLITGAGPTIVGFEVNPDPFDPDRDGRARLSATIAAPAGLALVEVVIFNLDDAFVGQVHEVSLDAEGGLAFELNETWDGRDEFGLLPQGFYRAQLVAFDTEGAGIADSETFELIHGEPPPSGEPDDPITFVTSPQDPPCCTCETPARRPAAPAGWLLVVAALWFVARRR